MPNEHDPLAIFTAPPADETPAQRIEREIKEADAKRTSDDIDEQLKKDRAAWKKDNKDLVKVLLLGQSESGKSTTLKSMHPILV